MSSEDLLCTVTNCVPDLDAHTQTQARYSFGDLSSIDVPDVVWDFSRAESGSAELGQRDEI